MPFIAQSYNLKQSYNFIEKLIRLTMKVEQIVFSQEVE